MKIIPDNRKCVKYFREKEKEIYQKKVPKFYGFSREETARADGASERKPDFPIDKWFFSEIIGDKRCPLSKGRQKAG